MLLRESLAWTLTALALWAAAGLVRRNNWLDGIWLVAAIAGTLWVRGTLAAVLLGGIVAGIVWARRRVPLPLIAALLAGLVVGGPLIARFTTITGSVDLQTVNAARASLSTANSGFETVAYSSPLSVIQSLPITMPRALLGPYPWEFGGLPTVTVFDWAGWMLLLWLAWRGWRRIEGRARWLSLIPALTMVAVIGATSGNYGTMVRLRPTAGVLLLPLAAAGVGRRRTPPLGATVGPDHSQLPKAPPSRRSEHAAGSQGGWAGLVPPAGLRPVDSSVSI